MGSKVSIIMPNYNGGEYIDHAIHSVYLQSYTNWELLIVDDCSTDNSWQIITDWRRVSDQIHTLQKSVNSGSPADPRNLAIATCSRGSKYIAFLDSDDHWRHDKLEKQVKYMDHSDCVLSYHNVDLYQAGAGWNKPAKKEYWTTKNKPYEGHCFNQLYKRNFMVACSIMAKAGVIKEQDTTLKISHDWDMWLRIARNHKIGYIPQALGTLRLHSGSTSAQTRLRRKESREVVRRWKGQVPRGLYYTTLMSYYLVELRDLWRKQ